MKKFLTLMLIGASLGMSSHAFAGAEVLPPHGAAGGGIIIGVVAADCDRFRQELQTINDAIKSGDVFLQQEIADARNYDSDNLGVPFDIYDHQIKMIVTVQACESLGL